MTSSLTPSLWNAILSMDAYNRGYDVGIEFHSPNQTVGKQLGTYEIIAHSSDLLDENGNDNIDDDIGFYALAYDTDGDGAADVISYRGTDDVNNIWDVLDSKDVWNGWSTGGGDLDAKQAAMAIEFYKEVTGSGNYLTAGMDLTGHSLGGGLAGLVGSIYGQNVYAYDAMPFLYALGNTAEEVASGNTDLQTLIFGDQTPWTIQTDHATLYDLINGAYISSEVLDIFRHNVTPDQYPEIPSENALYNEKCLAEPRW